jgi:hypothetical protein
MRTTRQFSLTLPRNMAEAVERKIKSGALCVREVMGDGMHALLERDAVVERYRATQGGDHKGRPYSGQCCRGDPCGRPLSGAPLPPPLRL